MKSKLLGGNRVILVVRLNRWEMILPKPSGAWGYDQL
jgi:hypothetical protein